MKRHSFLILLLASNVGYAQRNEPASVTGRITTSANTPVGAATVALHAVRDSTIEKIALADDDGVFLFSPVSAGSFFIRVSAIGFQHHDTGQAQVVPEERLDVGTIMLVAQTVELDAVEIAANRPLIESSHDRTVLNVGSMLSATGSSSLDIIKRAPGVAVNPNGTIGIRGRQGVLVLIDGRQIHLTGEELLSHLQGLPGDQLHQVEVITQPGAKYDAMGAGGVINLKTKKGMANGFAGTFTTGIRQGQYFNSNTNVDLGWKRNGLHAYLNASYALANPLLQFDIRNTYNDQQGLPESSVVQRFKSESTTSTPTARTGFDYTQDKTGFGLSYTANIKLYPAQRNVTYAEVFDARHELVGVNESNRTREVVNPIHSVGGYINRELGNSGSSLSLAMDYLAYHRPLTYFLENTFTASAPTSAVDRSDIKQHLPSTIDVYGAKLDYTYPITEGVVIQAGLKSTFMAMDNQAIFSVMDNAADRYEMDASRSTHYLFDENINAGYINYQHQLAEKWRIDAGLRVENTRNMGIQLSKSDRFEKDYFQFFPSLDITYQAHENHTINLNYGKRVNRPNYEQLIPYAFYLDLLYYQTGNPRLLPETADNVQLSHGFSEKLTTTISYSSIRDIMIATLRREPNTLAMEYGNGNIDRSEVFMIAVDYMEQLTDWYSVMATVSAGHFRYKGLLNGERLDAGRPSWMGQLVNQIQLPKQWSMELSANFESRTQDGPFAIAAPYGQVNIAFGKPVFNKKANLRLLLIDIFDTDVYTNESRLAPLRSWNTQQYDNRMFGLSLSYRFGTGQRQQGQKPTQSTEDEANRL